MESSSMNQSGAPLSISGSLVYTAEMSWVQLLIPFIFRGGLQKPNPSQSAGTRAHVCLSLCFSIQSPPSNERWSIAFLGILSTPYDVVTVSFNLLVFFTGLLSCVWTAFCTTHRIFLFLTFDSTACSTRSGVASWPGCNWASALQTRRAATSSSLHSCSLGCSFFLCFLSGRILLGQCPGWPAVLQFFLLPHWKTALRCPMVFCVPQWHKQEKRVHL